MITIEKVEEFFCPKLDSIREKVEKLKTISDDAVSYKKSVSSKILQDIEELYIKAKEWRCDTTLKIEPKAHYHLYSVFDRLRKLKNAHSDAMRSFKYTQGEQWGEQYSQCIEFGISPYSF